MMDQDPRQRRPLDLIVVENSPVDVELIVGTLGRAGLVTNVRRVDEEPAFRAALDERLPDAILADWSLSHFSGQRTLEIARERCPDVPFIFVSGVISESAIIEALRQGATDYVFKHQLQQLGPALIRALDEARALRSLRESAETYHSLSDNMLNGFAYCRMLFENGQPQDFIYLNVNKAFETQTGLKNVVGRKVSEIIPGIRESDPILFETYSRVAMTGQPEHFETYVEAMQMWLSISVHSPKREYFVAIFDVITERKQSEQTAERARGRLEVILKTASDGIHILDAEGLLIEANDAFLKMLGYDRTVIGHLHVTDWDVQMDGTAIQKILKEHIGWHDSLPLLVETRHRRSDGRIIDVEINVRGFDFDGQGCVCASSRDITERKRADETLRDSREDLSRLLNSMAEGAYGVDINGKCTFVNQAFLQILGYQDANEVLGKHIHELIHHSHSDGRLYPASDCRMYRAYQTHQPINESDEVFWRKDGVAIPVEYWSYPIVKSGVVIGAIATFFDITERKETETKFQRLTQLYAALSQCNEAIVRCSSQEELFPQICCSAVQFGGMKMAWVGVMDEASSMVRPAASCGEDIEYLDNIKISTDADNPFGRGPASTAIRENQPQWCQDFQHDPRTLPWHERSAPFGFGSSASLPLLCNGAVIGNFTLYASETNAFDEEARNLLVEMAANISFALDGFDREASRKQAVQVLAESEQRFRSLIEQPIAGIYIIQDGRFAYVNPHFAEIFGYASASELFGVEAISLVAEQDRGIYTENLRRRLENEVQSISYDFTAVRKDGSLINIGLHGARATHAGRPAIIGLIQDVSEKLRDEERIQYYVKQLEDAFMQTIEVVTTLVEMRDPYTAGHERRVAQIAVALGTELGLDANRIEGLQVGGYMHDVGKIIIPAEILSKPSRLSTVEYELIKGHSQAGYDILKNVDFPWPVAEIAYQHHERIDGSGYPRGLKGEEILLEARIMAVADVVEAMSSHRPYRPGLGIEEALAEIERGSGTSYDSVIADTCLRLFREKGYVLPVH